MPKAILGKKVGMTQIFSETGEAVPVTVIEAGPCVVAQKKTTATDGYNAIQVGYGAKRANLFNKPMKGHYEKAGIEPMRYLREFRVDDAEAFEIGQEIKADIFNPGDKVDVVGTSKGRGFTGNIKRHGYSLGPMSHGSKFHRGTGSMGAAGQSRVFKGKKLPGHHGADRVTVQNLEVVKVDAGQNLLAVKGAIPGPRGGLVMVKNSVKTSS